MKECLECYCAHIALIEADEQYKPKHHIVFHLINKMRWHGNPRLYNTWLDEALNKTLKGSCRQTSQATFERAVLLRMSSLLARPFKRAAP
jgi:hypothetical protein